jgi:hypothetical protein
MWLEIELSESGQKTIQKAGKASSVFLKAKELRPMPEKVKRYAPINSPTKVGTGTRELALQRLRPFTPGTRISANHHRRSLMVALI